MWLLVQVGPYGLPDTPIGLGGKMDDTSVVVGEVKKGVESFARAGVLEKLREEGKPPEREVLGGS